jgi:hypothetical protein
MIDITNRHINVQKIFQWFKYDHLPKGLPRDVSMSCQILAEDMITDLSDSAELAAGLRKLLEAKDCFVRAATETSREEPE